MFGGKVIKMKISISKEWVLGKAKDEKGFDVSAGNQEHVPVADASEPATLSAEEKTIPFAANAKTKSEIRP
jgi:hypothetical protein